MTNEQYFYEVFESMYKLGPGSDQTTVKALSSFDCSIDNPQVLDIGCGNGSQTFVLAKQLQNATITAIDNHLPFVQSLNKTAQSMGIHNRVQAKLISMFEMPFKDESFDLIWSEGVIDIAGFDNALADWKRLLKKNGYLICSDLCWTTDNPSNENKEFWLEDSPHMDTVDNKIKQIEKNGYRYVSHFILEKSDWEIYYSNMQQRLDSMGVKYKDNIDAKQVIAMLQKEINVFHKYHNEFGYIFITCQK